MRKFFFIISIFILFVSFLQNTFAAINFTVTPIKYELELQPWESITLPASIRNNWDTPVTLPTTASDFESSGTDGTPRFLRKSELVFPDQQLSSWISIADTALTIAPGQEETTNFTISVPETATPWGHYWAVFFKNDGSETSTSWNVWINVDYGIIILVNVSGEVIVWVEIEDPIISWGWASWFYESPSSTNTWSWDTNENQNDSNNNISDNGVKTNNWDTDESNNHDWDTTGWFIGNDSDWNPVFVYPDECPLWDFTTSKYDEKCFWSSDPTLFSEDDSSEIDWEWLLFQDDFEVKFEFPIKNTGNTHIKPSGKIVLKDENWIIKAIGKQTISNERGAVIWEEIVDYIPVNDQWGNILPSSQRIFESKWEWFPYKTFDDEWNPVVNYWTPSEFYTQKNKEDAGFLMFWERVSENRTYKEVTADIELIYYDEEWNPIEFNTSRTFPVQYIEQVVTINPYVILGILLIALAIILTLWALKWWIILFKENRCWSCDEKIKSHWKTCPHCMAIQNKRKHKDFEKQKELSETSKAVKNMRRNTKKKTVSLKKTK